MKTIEVFFPLLVLAVPLEHIQTLSFWWSVGDWSGHCVQFSVVLRLHTGSLKHEYRDPMEATITADRPLTRILLIMKSIKKKIRIKHS